MDPEYPFQQYKLGTEKKFTKLKFLEGDIIYVHGKVKAWAESTVLVMSSYTPLLHMFLTCFQRNVGLQTKNLLLEVLKSGSGCLQSIMANLGDLSQDEPYKHSPVSISNRPAQV